MDYCSMDIPRELPVDYETVSKYTSFPPIEEEVEYISLVQQMERMTLANTPPPAPLKRPRPESLDVESDEPPAKRLCF
jgi:hypothetical protein